MARASGGIRVYCGSGPCVTVPVGVWRCIVRLAERHKVAPAQCYGPQEGLRLARALRRGLDRVGQINRSPYREFTRPAYRDHLRVVIAMAEQGQGLTAVRP